MSDRDHLIARLAFIAHYPERFHRGEMVEAIEDSAAALAQSERELTNLGVVFRYYKIVHPEGTR